MKILEKKYRGSVLSRRSTSYWIKYPKEFRNFLDACEGLVKRTTQKIESDY